MSDNTSMMNGPVEQTSEKWIHGMNKQAKRRKKSSRWEKETKSNMKRERVTAHAYISIRVHGIEEEESPKYSKKRQGKTPRYEQFGPN